MEYLMARLSTQVARATSREPEKVKFVDYLRFHESVEPEKELTDKDISPEAFAAMFGARKKKE